MKTAITTEIVPFNQEQIILDYSDQFYQGIHSGAEVLNMPYALNVGILNQGRVELFYYQGFQYSLIINAPLQEGFLYFIQEFLAFKKLPLSVSFFIIDYGFKLGLDDFQIYKLFHLLNWPSSKKGLEYYRAVCQFSELLKVKIFESKLSLKDAFLFHHQFQTDYDIILEKIPERYSYSQANEMVSLIRSVSKKDNLDVNGIVALFNQNDKDPIKNFYHFKYPFFLKITNKFKSFLLQIHLPHGVQLDFDPSFEKEDYLLKVRFNNLQQLKKRISQIEKQLDQYSGKDHFMHENLFKTDE